MRAFALLVALAGCRDQPEPPVLDLTCPAVVAHVAELTLRPSDYARPLIAPAGPISETDPRAFRQRRIDGAIEKSCGALAATERGACARKVVTDAMAAECEDRGWAEERKRCLLDARDAAAIDACGPAPAPVLSVEPNKE